MKLSVVIKKIFMKIQHHTFEAYMKMKSLGQLYKWFSTYQLVLNILVLQCLVLCLSFDLIIASFSDYFELKKEVDLRSEVNWEKQTWELLAMSYMFPILVNAFLCSSLIMDLISMAFNKCRLSKLKTCDLIRISGGLWITTYFCAILISFILWFKRLKMWIPGVSKYLTKKLIATFTRVHDDEIKDSSFRACGLLTAIIIWFTMCILLSLLDISKVKQCIKQRKEGEDNNQPPRTLNNSTQSNGRIRLFTIYRESGHSSRTHDFPPTYDFAIDIPNQPRLPNYEEATK